MRGLLRAMKRHYFFLSFVFVFGISLLQSSCDNKSSSQAALTSEQRAQVIEKGNLASGTLMKSLGTQLKAAMSSGGPESAIHVCSQVAGPITKSTNAELKGITVSRTSLRVRNPENAPDEIDLRILNDWQKLSDGGGKLPVNEVMSVNSGTARFYKPIMVQAICLKCHGKTETLAPKLVTLLDEKYHQDKAIGYSEGDLRGVFRVEVELASGE